ncbi:MAG: hypothetical protein AABZ08_02590 [Planctomycetota bacterium]
MSLSVTIRRSILTAFVLLLPAPQLAAEPTDLAALFPETTLLYVALNGNDQTAEARKSTAYGKLVSDPQVQRFVEGVAKAVNDAIQKHSGSDEQAETNAAIKRVLNALWQHSTALAVLDAGMDDNGPFAQAAIVCKAGSDAEKLAHDVEALATVAGLPAGTEATVAGKAFRQVPLPLPGGLYYGTVSGHFIIALGDKTIEAIVNRIEGAEKDSLAKCAGLTDARKKIGGRSEGRIVTLYLDATGALARARMVMERMLGKNTETRDQFEQFAAAAQLSRLHFICYESYYHKEGILSGWVVQRAPAEGESTSGAVASITENDLAIIPRSASWAWAANVDLSNALAAYQSSMDLLEDEVRGNVTNWITDFEADIGFSLNDGMVQLIGDTVVLYDAPEAGGLWFTGTTAMLESSSAEKLQTNLRRLVKGIAKRVGKENLNIKTMEHLGHKIEFANVTGIPFPVAPAWTRHENWVVIGLYPQCVMAALDRLSASSPRESSILNHPDFIAARKVLGPLGSQVSYVDSKSGFESLYPFVLLFAQMGASAAQGEGLKLDISMFPSRDAITRHLFGEVSTTHSDANCDVQLSYGALPVNPSAFVGVSSVPLVVSIALPALSRARELSKRTVCASNLRGIGQGMYIYAIDHNDAFPPNFKAMLDMQVCTEQQFVCLSTGSTVGNLNADYEYIPGQKTSDEGLHVLVYEKLGNHQGEGINILFTDAHVEFVTPMSRAEKCIKETTEWLAKKSNTKAKKPKAVEKSDEDE